MMIKTLIVIIEELTLIPFKEVCDKLEKDEFNFLLENLDAEEYLTLILASKCLYLELKDYKREVTVTIWKICTNSKPNFLLGFSMLLIDIMNELHLIKPDLPTKLCSIIEKKGEYFDELLAKLDEATIEE